MRALDLKLLRELSRLRGQAVSIALVVAAGVMSAVTMRSTYVSLAIARDDYFRDYRFADVFASLQRAPDAVMRQILQLPGVATAEARIKRVVNLDVPGLSEPARGMLVSLPHSGEPLLNRIQITRGRMANPTAADEVVVSQRFAEWNHLEPGDTLIAVINSRQQVMRVVGRALSPEFIYEIEPGGAMFSDERLFGILWTSRRVLAAATDMGGAFNDVTLTLAPGATEKAVIKALDDVLRPYGGLGAYGRSEQASARVVHDEIRQNRSTATILPIVFLAVAAFLLHIVLHRLIATQRVNIATLKAFGYDNTRIGVHYFLFATIVVFAGVVLGLILGRWLGAKYLGLYDEVFRFPHLDFVLSWPTFFLAAGISAAAAILGAASAVHAALTLQAAEGMNPAPPAHYRALLLERWNLQRLLTPVQRMVLRNLERRPLRALLAAVGVGSGLAVMLVGLNILDSVTRMVERQFGELQREDLSVLFESEQPAHAAREIRRIDGVQRVESFRLIPVRLTHDHHTRNVGLTGLTSDGRLRALVDRRGHQHRLPPGGIVLTDRLAELLHIEVGDTLAITRLDASGDDRAAVVAGLVDELVGLNAYMDDRTLSRLFNEATRSNGTLVAIERGRETAVTASLKQLPDVSGVFSRAAVVRSFNQQLGESLRITFTILFLLAAVLASGVIYNSARIALSERGHELATLRVIGFSGQEVTSMLLGEQAAVTTLAVPVGTALGAGLGMIVIHAFDTAYYRIPFVMTAASVVISAIAVAMIAAASGWLVRRMLLRVDLVAALKVRE